jgi:hypothetical protein
MLYKPLKATVLVIMTIEADLKALKSLLSELNKLMGQLEEKENPVKMPKKRVGKKASPNKVKGTKKKVNV